MNKFKIDIGDVLKNGHKYLKSVIVESNVEVEEIRNAFLTSAKKMGLFDVEMNSFIVSEEGTNIPHSIIKILVENDVDLKDIVQDYDLKNIANFDKLDPAEYEEFEINQKSEEKAMVRLIFNIAKKEINFDYNFSRITSMPSFNDSKDLKFNIGYGLMDHEKNIKY